MSFRASALSFSYGLRDATFDLPSTGFVTIAGPNGAGKSTLLGILAGLRHPYYGECRYRGTEIRRWRRRDFARQVAFLPQSVKLEFPFTAEQVVFMGRAPYADGWFESQQDHEAVARAMITTDTTAFSTRDFRSLSGGEKQRVILASALAQEPETLLLDEPTTFLDLKHQLAMYKLLSTLAKKMLVVAVTHDLNLALRFSDHTIVMENGQIAAQGPPPEALAPTVIDRVFEVHAELRDGWLIYDA
ncbi:MAG TPA: ABC transporter ATP-binding protein [Bryobacteraceae bacterium]|jgi:iron complex transport system ATP-binding protein|nr:ABC transporter ATP-binding protein [Bryobacteraceae bacterium]